MGVGKSIPRIDAYAKVTGEAKYTSDLFPRDCLVAKVVHSKIANGLVKAIDVSEALLVQGVIKIVTCFDVPDITYPTPGHPWSMEESHQDIADRRLLNQRVRYYGDDIAAIIAKDDVAANKAARLIKVEYEQYEPVITVEEAMADGAVAVHDNVPGNVLKHTSFHVGEGSYEQAVQEEELVIINKIYETQRVQHCHIEPPVSFAYQEGQGKLVVVSSTQIPHIVRRVIGQALGISWGKIRVIKPYIGGGFGNKQDVLYEPLNAYLATLVHGRYVKLDITREETFVSTRTRHAMKFHVSAAARKDGTLVARQLEAYSNQGAYASHGHAIVANAANMFKQMYQDEKYLKADNYTVYTNTPVAGAMRGYGIPQSDFMTEALTDDMAYALKMDPLEFRLKNCVKEGYVDPHTKIPFLSYGLQQAMEKGKVYIGWEEKRKQYTNQSGAKRRGIGMAIFCYKTGVHPISLETASCRMVLNQDGSIQIQMGATEIGQGADTVFAQMAAEVLQITEDKIYVVSCQDTDVTPFDTGAYGSRQSYVSGKALKKTAQSLKEKILGYASFSLQLPRETLDIYNNYIIDKLSKHNLVSMERIAMEAFYSLNKSIHITAEETFHCKENTFASGVCFAEIEVDMPLGKIEVLEIINVHDSGVIINPALAKGQVHGGMSMGLGYALSEELLFDDKGKTLNDNLLDYKLPTAMDTPHLQVAFVEVEDESGPFGNKALGEPPTIPIAPAVRNAVLHATGQAFDSIPLTPQKLVERFMQAGLI